MQISLGREEASSEYDTVQEAAIHQIAADADAHPIDSDIGEAVPDSGSTRVLLNKIQVTQVHLFCKSTKCCRHVWIVRKAQGQSILLLYVSLVCVRVRMCKAG